MNKKEKFATINPWAICTAQVGRDSANYESCVMDIKKQYGLSEDLTEQDLQNKLPVYALTVQECSDGACPTEATAIALVTTPAIEVNFVAFSADEKPKTKPMKFKIQDAAKHMLVGPIMLADTPIYRRDPETQEEYYVTFDSQSINNIMKNMMKRGFNKNINVQHDDEATVDGAYLLEAWQVVDPKHDKLNSYGFKDIPVGSFGGVIYCPNEEIWNKYITTGELKGFSIEGVFAQSSQPISTFASNRSKLSLEDEKMIDELTRILMGMK